MGRLIELKAGTYVLMLSRASSGRIQFDRLTMMQIHGAH